MYRYGLVIIVMCVTCPVFGADVFVAPTGSDDGPGTVEHPLRTVQRGVHLLKPGDTCYVREGLYRETVTLKNSGEEGSPLRLRVYPGERAVFDGTEPVSGPWREEAGGVFAATTSMKIEQLFAGDVMLAEARWPNCTPDKMLTRDGWASSGPKSEYGTLHCPELGKTGIDWNGAMAILNVAHQFWTWSRTVSGYSPGSDELPYTITMNPFHYENRRWWDDDYFYLVGKREMLDAEGEWLATGDGTLRLIPPCGADPNGLNLRAKQRDYGITGEDLRFVEISGLDFFGCSFRLTDCEECVVEYCNLLYPSYARGIPNAEEKGKRRPCPGTIVSGRRNAIRSCSFEHCPNYGVVLQGTENVIEDSIVHDVNWYGTLHYTAVALRGGKGTERPKNVARHNTLYNVGNTILTCSGPSSVVEHNHVHHGGLISSDVSLLYTSMPAAEGIEFRYNWVHDSLSPSHSLGIRGDDKTRGLRVHHNVVWNVAKDGIVTKGGRNRVYNNTCLSNGASDICFNSGPEPDKWWQKHVKAYQHQNEDSLLVNNCASAIVSTRRRTQPPLPGDHSNNYTGRAPKLTDPAAFDFRPLADSPLVDAGRAVDGVTAAYEGAAPDVGAYEYGGEHWLPGHRNGVWVVRTGSAFSVRLNLPILEPKAIRVVHQGKQVATLRYTRENWSQPQTLPASIGTAGPLSFETDEWGSAVLADVAAVAGLADARAAFARPDIASARQVDSRARFDYEYSYTAEPLALPTWRAYLTEEPPVIDGAIEPEEWPGWDPTRAIFLESLAEHAPDGPPAAEGYALFDGKHLYLAVRVTADGDPLVRDNGKWGPKGSGSVEVDLASVRRRRVGPAFVLHAYPSGKLESVTDGGVDAEAARRFGAAVACAARPLGAAAWSCEFRVPLAALGIDGEEPAELRFNLALRHNGAPGGPWFAAVKTGGPDYAMAKAGALRFDRSVPASAQNLLTGGTFDSEDTLPWRLGSNRRSPLPEGTIQRVRQGLHQDGCIRIHADDAAAMKQRVIKWTHPIGGVTASSGRYCLSYNVRVVGKALSPQQDMGSFNSYLHVQQNGKPGGNLGQRSSMLTTTGDRWIRQDFVIDVPVNVKPSMISLQLHQAIGTVLVDNVSLLPCSD